MGQSLRLVNAPSALAAIHAEHLARQRRMGATSVVYRLPAICIRSAPLALEPKGRITANGEVYGPPRPSHLNVEAVIAAVSAYFGVSRSALRGPDRTAHVVFARHIAFYCARRLVKPVPSLPALGRRFSGRDHSTIWHGYHKIEWLAFGPEPDERVREALVAIAFALGRRL